MLHQFKDIKLTPSLARKLLLLNEVIPMNISADILQTAELNLLDSNIFGDNIEYYQFLDDNNLRGVVIHSDFSKFLDKTIKFVKYKKIKPILFVFENIMNNSTIISKIMKTSGLPYKIMPPESELNITDTIDVYFIDIKTLKKIKNKMFKERIFKTVFLEGQAMFKTQYILSDEFNTMPHIISFIENLSYKIDYFSDVNQYVIEKILGQETFINILTTTKWRKWAEKRGYNINEDIIAYISGISKHLKV